MLEGLDTGKVNIERMIVVGLPFVEILKIARDLDLPMIVMGIRGQSTLCRRTSLWFDRRKSPARHTRARVVRAL